ncbi:sulfatase [Compostibacter hankyongensis]|uniref:Sulfatase n=1 Tax=Compostibacter hankyongensis TaxID=1007089 RepID=A0ABP8FRK6_9BACT
MLSPILIRLFSFFLLMAAWAPCQAQTRPASLPNIVLIYMDDMGYGDVDAYGGIGYTTPNIDRLAAQGMRFTNFYSAQPICSASRAAILTGCYPNRIGFHGALMPHSPIGISGREETIAGMLKKKGYATAIIGKWHLGDARKFLPLQHGFDTYFGLPYSNDMWPVGYDGKPFKDTSSPRAKWPPLPLIDGNKVVRYIRTLDDQSMLTTWYTERAVQFINHHRTQPFFLYFAQSMVHVPLGVSDKFKGKSKQGLFGDVMMEIDWSVGQVMKALKENGMENNTLFIFTSDNGPWLTFGNHAGSAGALREGKATTWEGGQREPAIIRWPGRVPEGTVCNKLAANIDLLPTLAAVTGAPLPANKIDGVNILSLLKGDPGANPRDHLFYYYHLNSLEAVRQGPWKLILPHPYHSYEGQLPGKDGWPGRMHKDSTGLALYDLRRDPGERYDVKAAHPEVVTQLQQLAEEAREDLGDDLTGRKGKNRRPPGRL